MTGGVYLIQPCELKGTNRYKIGYGSDVDKRVKKGYKKGTVILYRFYCKYPKIVEKYIIKKFNENFENNAGNEYFKGEKIKMKRVFFVSFWEKCDKVYQGKLHAVGRIQAFWRLWVKSKKISEYKKKISEYKLYYFKRWFRLHEKYQNFLNHPYIIKTSEEFLDLHPDLEFIITNRKKGRGVCEPSCS